MSLTLRLLELDLSVCKLSDARGGGYKRRFFYPFGHRTRGIAGLRDRPRARVRSAARKGIPCVRSDGAA